MGVREQPRSSFEWVLTTLATACALCVVYGLSAPRSLPDADAGEFAALAVAGGIGHPPGYPIFNVLLQGFARLAPWLGLCVALSWCSILAAAAAACLLVRVLMARGHTAFAAFCAVLAVFLSCNVWRAATTLEPFALNLLLASGLLYCAHELATRPAETTARVVLATGVLFGLGACNHHSLALFAPLPLSVFWARRHQLPRPSAWPVLFAMGLALGLTPVALFLWLRGQTGFVWGDWQDFGSRLVTHVLRREYGSVSLAPSAQGSWSYGPARMLSSLPVVLSFVFCGAALAGVARVGHSQAWAVSESDRGFRRGVALCFVSSGLLFPMLFRLPGTPLDNLICDRFFALPMLCLVFPIASGLAFSSSAGWRALLLVLLVAHLCYQWAPSSRAQHRVYEDELRNVFATLEPNATLMIDSDSGYAGGLFGRYVLRRGDVVVVNAGLNLPWYRARIASELAAGATAQRPLYLFDLPRAAKQAALLSYPLGPVLRVVRPDESLPSARRVFQDNEALFAKLRLPTAAELANADAWEDQALTDYARAWDLIGTRLVHDAEPELAQRAFAYRDAFAPRAR